MENSPNRSELKCSPGRALSLARAWKAHIRAMVTALINKQAKLSAQVAQAHSQ